MRALVVVLSLLLAAPAWAKSSRDYGYPPDQVWPALVRFLRIDEKMKIVEKDTEVHYILFELVDGKKTFRGSAELRESKDADGRPVSRVWMKLVDRPAYMEEGMLERLEQKLRDELGDPPPPPDAPEPKEPEKPKADGPRPTEKP